MFPAEEALGAYSLALVDQALLAHISYPHGGEDGCDRRAPGHVPACCRRGGAAGSGLEILQAVTVSAMVTAAMAARSTLTVMMAISRLSLTSSARCSWLTRSSSPDFGHLTPVAEIAGS